MEQLHRPSSPLRGDAGLISFSMTRGLLPILTSIVAHLVLRTVLMLIPLFPVQLVGGFVYRSVLLLISVVLVPWVCGLGHQNLFQELHGA